MFLQTKDIHFWGEVVYIVSDDLRFSIIIYAIYIDG